MRLNEHKNTAEDYKRARKLRNEPSPIEWKLWNVLRKYAAAKNIKFRRQQAIHPYIADFACMKARLLVEIDGDSHAAQEAYDKMREEKLKQMGFSVLRFTNQDVTENAEGVVMIIVEQAENLLRNGKRQT